MAPPNEILPALGDLEWATIGGKVDAHCHPSGRVSYVYIAPDGGERFRSWKQALVYMGEDESGPLAQQARERHNSILKSSIKPPNPRASQKRRQKSSSSSPNTSVPTKLQQQATGEGSGGSPVTRSSLQASSQAGTHSPLPKSKKSKNLFPKAVIPLPTEDSSLPPSMSKRNRKEALGDPKEAPGNQMKKSVNPSTFTRAAIGGSSSLPNDSSTISRPSNSLAMSSGPSQSLSQYGAGDDDSKEAQPPRVIRAEPSHVEPPPKEPIKGTKPYGLEKRRNLLSGSTSTGLPISPATAQSPTETKKSHQAQQGGVRGQMSSHQDVVILDSSADDELAAGLGVGLGLAQEEQGGQQHLAGATSDAKARANAKKRQKKKEKKAAAAAELLRQALEAPVEQQTSIPQETSSVVLPELVAKKREVQSGESGRTAGSDSDFRAGEEASDGACALRKEPSSRRPRRAAAGKNFKEKRIRLDETDARLPPKMPALGKSSELSEEVVIVKTATKVEDTPQRGLLDFVVHDWDGNFQQIERMGYVPLYFTGLVNPIVGSTSKENCVTGECLGPIISWCIQGYEDGNPGVVLITEMAEYYCQSPIGAYRKSYNILFDKGKVCVEAAKLLSKPGGGDPSMQMEDLIARLCRVFSRLGAAGQFFSREFILRNGVFIALQLYSLDPEAREGDQIFSGLPALVSLEKGGKETKEAAAWRSRVNFVGQSFTIAGEGSSASGGSSSRPRSTSAADSMLTDEQLARRLQEEVDRGSNVPSKKQATGKPKYYVKINEAEIANDYPMPDYYKAEEEETDEYVLFDDYVVENPDDLPHRKLHDWTLYNTDMRLVSLELLPMLPGAETDMEIFGSGVITEDDGSGFELDGEDAEAAADGAEGSSAVEARSAGPGSEQGIRIYLSAIKEWKIEFGANMLFISFRTDGAWYRLGKSSAQYYPWYRPVLKTARLAIRIITMLHQERRVNLLSFNDVIKKLMNQTKEQPTYISGRQDLVQRYVIVHGQILLQQFSEYPDERIRRSAFISGLSAKMEEVSHTKLKLTKKRIFKKEKNLNPRAVTCPDGHKRKPMRATTTRLVDNIWSGYYAGTAEGEAAKQTEVVGKEVDVVEEEFVEDSDDEEIVRDLKPAVRGSTPRRMLKSWKGSAGDLKWIGEAETRTVNNERVFKKAIFRGIEYEVGNVVMATLEVGIGYPEFRSVILLIEYLYETKREGPLIHGRVMQKGPETILGNAARERELFLTDLCEDVELDKITSSVTVEIWNRKFGYEYRKENAEKDAADKAAAEDREKKGLPLQYFCRAWYSPERGGFFSLPRDTLAIGTGSCKACQSRRESEERLDVQTFANDQGFRFQGIDYRINDYIYLDPETFESKVRPTANNGLFKGGRNKGLRAFAICQLLSVLPLRKGGKENDSRLMKVRRFYRPEDVDKFKAYKADIHEVYYSEVMPIVDTTTARGKCVVVRQIEEVAESEKRAVNDIFFCDCTHDPATGTVKQLPMNFKLISGSSLEEAAGKSQAEEIAARTKGKGKVPEYEMAAETPSDAALSTLDIFAGCGGLSEGLHQSGASITKWAVEYDYPASEAFKLNHPSAAVFCDNCNVILRSIMEVGGDLDDCISTTEATELSLKLDAEKKRSLPRPGQVDFISGGPPCQGFSGMNRFNTRAWSKVQCEMILAYLSFAEYLRPRYFLLENVRNFVSFNKGQTFRLTLMTLLEMGYQVRFGVLQAGNYGVSQSRKRAFIWAGAPEETLPEWPQPRHVFASSQLGVTLPGNYHYSAVRDAGLGAPFRAMTVRDTVADLPKVANGAQSESLSYTDPPVSWFQVQIRGDATRLIDHISKEMNELNLLRCQRIPKEPGADWRKLPDEKVQLSSGHLADLIPWCLPNTAERHNQWKGLFGRLDWDGNFPTSITDPQPMGKVGMCFHPVQDRIVTVRECARSQGFPDRYKFFGNINAKHRQIGNAVPPPLSRALGLMLKEAMKAEKSDKN